MKKKLSTTMLTLLIVLVAVSITTVTATADTLLTTTNNSSNLASLDKVTVNVLDGELMLSGYEVFRSLNKNTGYGDKAFFMTTNQAYNNTSVKLGNRYYYKVRGYILSNGIKYYTNWSTVGYRMVKKNNVSMVSITSYPKADQTVIVSGKDLQDILDNVEIKTTTKLVSQKNNKPAVTVTWTVDYKKSIKDVPKEEYGGMSLAQIERMIEYWKNVDWSNYPASSKRTPEVAVTAATGLKYDGTEQSLVTGSTTGGNIQYALGTSTEVTGSYSDDIPKGKEAGKYYVWYKVEGDSNYNDVAETYKEVTILKRSVTLTSASASKTYDATPITDDTVTVTGDGFITGEGATYSVTGSQTTAGTSDNTFTYTLDAGTTESNYSITKVEGELTVNKKQLTISGTTVSDKTYDGTTTASVTTAGTLNNLEEGDAVTVSATGTFSNKSVGEGKTVSVTYSISGVDASNYEKPDDGSTIAKITKKQLTVSGTTVSSKTYDGTTAATATKGTVSGVVNSETVEVSVDSANFSDENVGTDKTVTVTYALSGTDSGNYIKPVNDTLKANITAKLINVKADDKSSSKGSALVVLTYTNDALCGSDSFSGSLTTLADKDTEGTYDITQGNLSAGSNYSITFTKGIYTVNAKELQTLSFDTTSVSKTYGDSNFTKAVTGAQTTVTYSSSDTTVATVDSSTGEVTIVKAGNTTIKASAVETATYLAGEATYSLTVNKATQTAPTAPTFKSATSNTLTVVAIETTGQGDTEYAVNTSNSAPETGWQTSTTFSGLTEGTNYYFFARYKGNENYESAVSDGANLGLGYTLTFVSGLEYSGDFIHNPASYTVAHVDEEETTIGFSGETPSITVNSASATLPITLYNVKSIDGTGNYICYVKDGESTSNTHDCGNPALALTLNINITKVGTSNCIDENTMITMADGSLKAMKYIETGDEVLSIDYETMTLVARTVIYTSKDEPSYSTWTVPSYYLHTFSDGTTIKRAMRHRFYNLEVQGYKHMDYWTEGLHAFKIDGTNPELVSTEIVQEQLHYARITLEGSNNYFANGLSTGDSECCPNKVTLNTKLEKAE